MKDLAGLKVAIVHDWLVGGGAEQVVLELHRMFPDAPIYTSYCSPEWRQKLDGRVVTGFLQRWPFSRLRKFLPVLRIWWFTRLDFTGYDLVISSSGNGEAKGVRVPAGTRHICYCHTPTHFYWRHYQAYLAQPGFGAFNPLARLGLKLLVGPLRRWDLKASQRPDLFIANSTHIQADIKTYYKRDSVVIHPPVNLARFQVGTPTERQGFITVGRFKFYKRLDLIIDACNELGLPLKIIGYGPELAALQKMAGRTITFLVNPPDEELVQYVASAEAFIFAAEEDFGIAPVEALAAGTPVIAYRAGGALDYVIPGQTGAFFEQQTVESLVATLKNFNAVNYDPAAIKQHAKNFGPDVFRQKLGDFVAGRLVDAG